MTDGVRSAAAPRPRHKDYLSEVEEQSLASVSKLHSVNASHFNFYLILGSRACLFSCIQIASGCASQLG